MNLQFDGAALQSPSAETLATYFPAEWSGLHPRHTHQLNVGTKTVGVVFGISPVLLSTLKLRGSASMILLDCAHMLECFEGRKFLSKPIAYTPSSVFDCTVVAGERTEAAKALAALSTNPLLVQAQILSVFPLEAQQKAVTLRLTFQDTEKTLSTEAKREFETRALQELAQAGFALRGA